MATQLDYFQIEAAERLERLSTGLMSLERSPDDRSLIGDLFRDAHSLKGAAGVSGLKDVSEVCHKMEDLLSGVRDGSKRVDSPMIDALLAATDAVGKMVAARVEGEASGIIPGEVIRRLAGLEPRNEPAPGGEAAAGDRAESVERTAERPPKKGGPPFTEERPSPGPARHGAAETVRLDVDLLESLANRTGELMVAGDRLRQRLRVLRELHRLVRREQSRHEGGQVAQQVLQPIATGVHRLIDDFAADFTVIEPLIAEIHERTLDTRMLPLSVLFDLFPRFVRDHCRQEQKQVDLRLEGAETRVDRQVLEQLRDPMIHLIRNALSHGIESPAERKEHGKSRSGTLRLGVSCRGDWIRITCEDDGRGIDRRKVLAKAIENDLIGEAEAAELPVGQVDRLILRPGFSTAETVTDASGRGIGMDVVQSRMDALHGTLEIASEPMKFTRFVLEFPASLATIEGLLAEAGGYTYVLPTVAVERTERVEREEFRSGGGGEELVEIGGRAVPLLMLADLLGLGKNAGEDSRAIPVVLVRCRDGRVALGVDRLLGTQTIVRKGLGEHIRGVRGVAGATLLGTGLPALILEPSQLVREGGARPANAKPSRREREVEKKPAPLLVVDDSITTRMMEQSILESAGYEVDTAVSAEDALAKIERSAYRLFVVDVQMPGRNGFQLTKSLRQDKRFAETPIVIVSSLAREEDRREGLEAGANAYIVKSEFDQNRLLDTVRKLVGS